MVDLPLDCGGMVSLSPDGHYNIYINARLGKNVQRKKLYHEIIHIINDDINNDEDIRVVEARAEGRKRKESVLSTLMKAKDLLPMPEKKESVKANVPYALTRRQIKVVLETINLLDIFLAMDLGDT